MASSKETHASSRPLTLHRPSLSMNSPSGLVSRQAHARTSSHSVTLGSSLSATHRVSRRKSMTNTATNVAAMTAAIREAAGETSTTLPIAMTARRNTSSSKSAAARSALMGSLPSPPQSLPSRKFLADVKGDIQGSAIDDDPVEMSADEGDVAVDQARVRRASDGQPLAKEGKRFNRIELKCDKCGKGYKHSSCLTKHLWEHTPEWSLTSKLLISKHQQVQLLEAASVLLAMNNNKDSSETPPDSAKDFPSDPESASPGASGYSEQPYEQSSASTTPPPVFDSYDAFEMGTPTMATKRHSSALSRALQPGLSSNPLVAGSAPNGSGFGHFRQASYERRPPSSGRNATGQDDRDLAAAVELLSCSFGSNNGSSRHMGLPADAPPVPPVPAQYRDQAASLSSTHFLNSFPLRQPESFTRGETRHDSHEDVKMEDSAESGMDDDDDDMHSRARSDEDDDGVFGRMEE